MSQWKNNDKNISNVNYMKNNIFEMRLKDLIQERSSQLCTQFTYLNGVKPDFSSSSSSSLLLLLLLLLFFLSAFLFATAESCVHNRDYLSSKKRSLRWKHFLFHRFLRVSYFGISVRNIRKLKKIIYIRSVCLVFFFSLRFPFCIQCTFNCILDFSNNKLPSVCAQNLKLPRKTF